MAGGISIHAVDVASGRPAAGMQVEVHATTGGRRVVATGTLDAHGGLHHPIARGEGVVAGEYEALFQVGAFLRSQGRAHAGFLETIVFRFNIAQVEEHFHLPLKFTAWGYSLFRGS